MHLRNKLLEQISSENLRIKRDHLSLSLSQRNKFYFVIKLYKIPLNNYILLISHKLYTRNNPNLRDRKIKMSEKAGEDG